MKNNTADTTIKEIELEEAHQSLTKAGSLGVVIGFIGIFFYAKNLVFGSQQVMFIGFLLAIATFVCGFFTGTLFGMPKRNMVKDSDYTLNNSLVEISDWLTKIIVGLGLVNLKQIPVYLVSLGKYISDSTMANNQSIEIYAECIVVFYAVLGLYTGYNYMRLVLSQKYKQADDNLLKENRQLRENIEMIVEETNRTEKNTTLLERNDNIEELKARANEKLRKGMETFGEDPQKSQWGGKTENNDRRLEASVKELGIGYYSISLKVISTNPNANPLEEGEVVLFALHDTFGSPPFRYAKVENGAAETKVISYGSFTVGAFVDKGNTELELDLAKLPGVSDYFKNH